MTGPIIPSAALAQHIAVLGKNGSGKTYATKATIVEPLLAADKRVAIIDPTSAWWGLRTSADGRAAGFKVLVLGGDHGDLPLPALGGAAVARLIVEQNVNIVADTGSMTVGERTRWMIDFAGTLYRLNRAPLHLVIDEAHVFAPQGKVPDPDTGRMLHAVNQIAAGGRSRGIRLTMLTQRPQKLHKDALTTADTLIAMRVLAPQDRDAVKAWIDGCGDPAQGREVLASLANLKRGEGWVWYPEGGVLQRLQFPRIKTFDSSATPKDGDAPVAPKGAAEIDLTEIKAALASAVQEAEANDPKRLRARIADLERQVKQQPAATPPAGYTMEQVQAACERADREAYERGAAAGMRSGWKLHADTMAAAIATIVQPDFGQPSPPPPVRPIVAPPVQRAATPATRTVRATPARGLGPAVDLPRGEEAVLRALIQYPNGLRREQLTVLTGYKRSSRDTYIQRLRERGLVEAGNVVKATQAGLDALPDAEPLPSGPALQSFWFDRLPEGERAILKVLVDRYPTPVTRDELSDATRYKRSSRDTYLQRLSAKELVEEPTRGFVRASEDLFA